MKKTPEDPLFPDFQSAGSYSPGVRRLNGLPVLLFLVVCGIVFGTIIWVNIDKSRQNNPTMAKAQESVGGDTTMALQEFLGDVKDGIIPPATETPKLLSLQARTQEGGPVHLPPATPIGNSTGNVMAAPKVPQEILLPPEEAHTSHGRTPTPEEERLHQLKRQQLEEAITSKISVPLDHTTTPQDDVQGEVAQRLKEVRHKMMELENNPSTFLEEMANLERQAGNGAIAPQKPATPQGVEQFAGKEDRWKIGTHVEAPSPYQLRAGFVIPALLLSGINSELPGQIIAQVSQSVYDTPSGRYVLIPQGSRLIGSYSSNIAYGQSRVLVAWQRIVFPDGKALDMGAMPGADGEGASGFEDQVNNHYLRIFGSALLMSGVVAGVSYSQERNGLGIDTTNTPTASSAMSEALGQELGQVTAQMIAKNMNIAPTLEIRPGFRFNVIVTRDLTFAEPYQG